jgi:hypothetical protein
VSLEEGAKNGIIGLAFVVHEGAEGAGHAVKPP